jgi:hypothetical protein
MNESEEYLEQLKMAGPSKALRQRSLDAAQDAWDVAETPAGPFLLKLAAGIIVLLSINGLCQVSADRSLQTASPWGNTALAASPPDAPGDAWQDPLSEIARSVLERPSRKHEDTAWHLRQHQLCSLTTEGSML